MSAPAPVVVYSKPNCIQCDYTYKALDKRGIDYTVIDITQDAAAREYVRGLGYLQAPVVVAGADHWSGLNLDKIAALRPARTSIEGAAAQQTSPATAGLAR